MIKRLLVIALLCTSAFAGCFKSGGQSQATDYLMKKTKHGRFLIFYQTNTDEAKACASEIYQTLTDAGWVSMSTRGKEFSFDSLPTGINIGGAKGGNADKLYKAFKDNTNYQVSRTKNNGSDPSKFAAFIYIGELK